jgi:hypothetical protein
MPARHSERHVNGRIDYRSRRPAGAAAAPEKHRLQSPLFMTAIPWYRMRTDKVSAMARELQRDIRRQDTLEHCEPRFW